MTNQYNKRHNQHGHTRADRVYRIWIAMRSRCNSPNDSMYPVYGGRGIKVCKRWSQFRNFLADMGEPPSAKYSIDRIKNDGDYKPSNCRWATRAEQARNKSNNVSVTFEGRTQCLTDWAAELELSVFTLHSRLSKLGWTVERALSTPAGQQGKAKVYIAHGTSLTLKGWAAKLGVSPNTLQGRIRYGWPVERVFRKR